MSAKRFNSPESAAKAAAAWALALRLQQFGYSDVSSEVTVSMQHATHIVRTWERQGKVRPIAVDRKGGAGRKIYEVVPEHELRPALEAGDAYDQMWLVMRKIGAFSPVDLTSHCALPISLLDAAAYCRLLLTTGYLRVIQKAKPPHKPAIYRLINATGPRAPRHRRVSCIVDPNRGTILPIAEVSQ